MTGFIYMVTNNITGKRYVGKTSTTVDDRWKGHVSEASRNLSNSALHKAINKYGQDAFSLTVLLKNIPIELLNHYEFYGKHHSDATKKHLSEIRSLAVEMLSRQGEYLRTFCSAKAAGDYMMSEGLTSNKYANSLILDACKGKVSYAYGFCWRFHESVETNCKLEDELPAEAQRISSI